MDCEDSVAAVDAEDKTLVYRNWLGLMKGDLSESLTRAAELDAHASTATAATPPGRRRRCPEGRSLMLVRNVGHLMTNPAILDATAARSPRASWTR
jgi:malate synthase